MHYFNNILCFLGLIVFIVFSSSLSAAPPAVTPPSSPQKIDLTYELKKQEFHRSLERSLVLKALGSKNPEEVQSALLAIARVSDIRFRKHALQALQSPVATIRQTAAFTLGLLSMEKPSNQIKGQLMLKATNEQDQHAKAEILLAVARAGGKGDINSIRFLENALKTDRRDPVLNAGVKALAHLLSKQPKTWKWSPTLEKALLEKTLFSAPVGVSAAYAIASYPGEFYPFESKVFQSILKKVPSHESRAYLCRYLSRVESPSAKDILIQLLNTSAHIGTRIEATRGLVSYLEYDDVPIALMNSLQDPSHHVQVQALRSLRNLKKAPPLVVNAIQESLKKSKSDWVRSEALIAFGQTAPEQSQPFIQKFLKSHKQLLRNAAITTLGIHAHLPELIRIIGSQNQKDAQAALLALNDLPRKIGLNNLPEINELFRSILKSEDVGLIHSLAQVISHHRITSLAKDIHLFLSQAPVSSQLEGVIALIQALKVVGSESDLSLLSKLSQTPIAPVAVAASETFEVIAGKPPKVKVPRHTFGKPDVPLKSEWKSGTRVRLMTSRGEIRIQMLPSAPMTSTHFIHLVQSGFFQGKTFHRIVPHFIAQGGDPRGDGLGGPGYYIREELSSQEHSRGTVGLATSGKDMGGSQFFINQATNLQLDARYTVFGRVTRGMSVVDRLEPDDKILTATVLP